MTTKQKLELTWIGKDARPDTGRKFGGSGAGKRHHQQATDL